MESHNDKQLPPYRNNLIGENPLDKLGAWIKKNIKLIFCVLVVSLVLVRGYYYYAITNSPLYNLYQADETDNRFFDDWAKNLNTDWLNKNPLHPYHPWHKAFADYYFSKHPEKLRSIINESHGNPALIPGKTLWNEWYHGNQYHQEPLYPYILAVLYHFHINEINAIILIQLSLGVLSGILLFLLTRKYFGETVAVLTGFLYLLCGILLYHEVILLRTSWIVFLTILNVLIIDKAFYNTKPAKSLLYGSCIGISFLMQSTFILYLFAGIIAIFLNHKKEKFAALKNSGIMVAGFFLIFLPVIIRNQQVGAPVFSVSSVSVPDIVSCNVYGTKSITGWQPSAEKDAEIIAQSYGSITKAISKTVSTYPSLGSFLLMEWQKLRSIWVGIEYPNNENFYFYKAYTPLLSFTFVNFFLIMPLSVAGVIFCLVYKKRHWPFYVGIAIQLAALLATVALARFRAPLVLLLLPFSAYAIVECINVWNKRRVIVVTQLGLIVVLLFGSFSTYSSNLDAKMVKADYYGLLYKVTFEKKLDQYVADKKWNEWLKLQEQFLNMEPPFLKKIEANAGEANTDQIETVLLFSKYHKDRKEILDTIGNKNESDKEYNTYSACTGALISAYDNENNYDVVAGHPLTSFKLAKLYIDVKRYKQAVSILQKCWLQDPGNEGVNLYLGKAFLFSAQYDSSEVYAKKTLEVDSANTDAMFYLSSVYFFRKQFPQAINLLKQQIKINPGDASKYDNIGNCFLFLGEIDSAITYTSKAISIDPKLKISYRFMSIIYKTVGKMDSAKKFEELLSNK